MDEPKAFQLFFTSGRSEYLSGQQLQTLLSTPCGWYSKKDPVDGSCVSHIYDDTHEGYTNPVDTDDSEGDGLPNG